MNIPKITAELAVLRDAALEDLAATSDAELHREALDDGEDIAAIAHHLKSSMCEAASAVLRQRMVQAQERMRTASADRPLRVVRPTLEHIKQLVQEAFQRDRSLGLAFRDGKRQSDSDWQTLYDDLV
jgi:hypothetical protein